MKQRFKARDDDDNGELAQAQKAAITIRVQVPATSDSLTAKAMDDAVTCLGHHLSMTAYP